MKTLTTKIETKILMKERERERGREPNFIEWNQEYEKNTREISFYVRFDSILLFDSSFYECWKRWINTHIHTQIHTHLLLVRYAEILTFLFD